MILEPSKKIYLDKSKMKHAGRGVFARQLIKKGEIIEHCPVIDLSPYDTQAITEGTLISYLYYFGKKKDRSVITLGYGAIYNHTYNPNAMYKENHKKHIVSFIAIKDIKKDEEITVNYLGEKSNKEKTSLWFE